MPEPYHRVFEGRYQNAPMVFTHEEFKQLPLDPPYSDNYRDAYTWSLPNNNKKARLSCCFRGPSYCDWITWLVDDA